MKPLFLSIFVAALFAIGCGGVAPPDGVCTPGQAVACVGPGACAGGQVCNLVGSGYGECSCAIGDPTPDANFGPDSNSDQDAGGDSADINDSGDLTDVGANDSGGSLCSQVEKENRCSRTSSQTPWCVTCGAAGGYGCGSTSLCVAESDGGVTCGGGISYLPAGTRCPLDNNSICDGQGWCVTSNCGEKNQAACPGSCLEGSVGCNCSGGACCFGWGAFANTNSGGPPYCCGTTSC